MSDTIDTTSEKALIVSILSDETGNTLLDVIPQLSANDFQDERNQMIYQAMIDLSSLHKEITVVNLIDILENKHQLDLVGGEAYFDEISSNNNLFTGSINDNISNIKDKALLVTFVQKLKSIVYDSQTKPITDPSDFMGKCEEEILQITHNRRNTPVLDMQAVANMIVNDLVKQTDRFIKKGKNPNGVTGIETGFESLDRLTKGWREQEMIIIGARPSVGKTAFVLQLLYNIAKRDVPVLFFSLEMDEASIGRRILSNITQLPSEVIDSIAYKHGSTYQHIIADPNSVENTKIISVLQQGLLEFAGLPIFIDANPGTKLMDITSKAKKVCNSSTKPIGLIAIDYMQLISCPTYGGSSVDEVTNISKGLKQLARELNVPIIVLSQLSRAAEKDNIGNKSRELTMSDLRGSGSIEQDADKIFFLSREDYQKTDEEQANNPISHVSLSLQKNRNGRIGKVDFQFNKETSSFIITDFDHSAE